MQIGVTSLLFFSGLDNFFKQLKKVNNKHLPTSTQFANALFLKRYPNLGRFRLLLDRLHDINHLIVGDLFDVCDIFHFVLKTPISTVKTTTNFEFNLRYP